jgi:hypothetical protein
MKADIADMILRGLDNAYMSKKLGIAPSLVCYYRDRIEEEWRYESLDDIDLWKRRELKVLEYLYRQALEGWERSLTEQKKQKQSVTKNGTGEDSTTTQAKSEVQKQERSGDPRFLSVANDLRAKIISLLGLEKKIGEKDNDDMPVSPTEARKELARILKRNKIDSIEDIYDAEKFKPNPSN